MSWAFALGELNIEDGVNIVEAVIDEGERRHAVKDDAARLH